MQEAVRNAMGNMLLASILYLPVSILFFHSPALVHWYGVPVVRSLFFSAVAVLRNTGAFFVYFMGWTMVGMTASPEVFLAREAEICYATMAHVTDYDSWHSSEKPVTVDMVIRTLNHNTALAQSAIETMVELLPVEQTCHCSQALEGAVITDIASISPAIRQKYQLLISKYLES